MSCQNGKNNDVKDGANLIDTEMDGSNSTRTSMEDYDWIPIEFKIEHYDEWEVVNRAIAIQQREGETDYNEIDRIVREYISNKKIALPAEKYQQIKEIEKICDTKFNIWGYDDSNMGMHIAEGTELLFADYVNWLLAREAKKVENTGIDFQEEEKMLKSVMDAFTDCCDTIGYAFQGSGGWMDYAVVHQMEIDYKKSMYTAVLRPLTHKERPGLLTAEDFKKECENRIRNYKQDEWGESPSRKTVGALINRYYVAMEQWLEYRKSVEKNISNPELKDDYSYITRTFAKEQYEHLKSNFERLEM